MDPLNWKKITFWISPLHTFISSSLRYYIGEIFVKDENIIFYGIQSGKMGEKKDWGIYTAEMLL